MLFGRTNRRGRANRSRDGSKTASRSHRFLGGRFQTAQFLISWNFRNVAADRKACERFLLSVHRNAVHKPDKYHCTGTRWAFRVSETEGNQERKRFEYASRQHRCNSRSSSISQSWITITTDSNTGREKLHETRSHHF